MRWLKRFICIGGWRIDPADIVRYYAERYISGVESADGTLIVFKQGFSRCFPLLPKELDEILEREDCKIVTSGCSEAGSA